MTDSITVPVLTSVRDCKSINRDQEKNHELVKLYVTNFIYIQYIKVDMNGYML